MTLSNNASQAFVKSLGSAAAGVIVSQITPAPDLVSSRLGQEFKVAAKASGATVSYAAMEGFVAAKVLVEGLRRAG
ncbi:MAG TPA: ABC transporter permease, partial [Oxalobacteraceae bacterium]|nr:ABC transporter permease [Oxalobacteraceae bacterium]